MTDTVGVSRLKAIKFSKYRGFVEEQLFDIKPITLLFGHNSVGKSAALRLIPILAAASQKLRRNNAVLDYSAAALRGANFADIVSNGQISAAMSFTLVWEDKTYQFRIQNIDASTEIVSNFVITESGNEYVGEVNPKQPFGAKKPIYSSFDVTRNGKGGYDTWRLEGIRPNTFESEQSHPVADELRHALDAFGSSVFWLEAIRSSVPRIFEVTPGSNGTISSDGSGVAQALQLSNIENDGIAESVSRWLERTCECSIKYSASTSIALSNRQFFPFNVSLKSGGQIAVRDIGEGIAQALPVVTLCHQARLGKLGHYPILAFEQPELHLHPSAIVELADEIISCVIDDSEASHIIETHAESMLLAVQIAIVEKRIKSSDAIVYWVNNQDSGTLLRPITFDDEGYPIGGWPQGVFRETLDQSRRLSKLRIDLGAE